MSFFKKVESGNYEYKVDCDIAIELEHNRASQYGYTMKTRKCSAKTAGPRRTIIEKQIMKANKGNVLVLATDDEEGERVFLCNLVERHCMDISHMCKNREEAARILDEKLQELVNDC